MTPKQEAALRLALETFERMGHKDSIFAGEFNGEITALREALAEQPVQPCGYPYCGCNSKAWCKVEQQSGIKQVIELYDSPEQPVQQQEPVAWCPDVCPITGLPFFMWIEHHETGQKVPTYGGPYDSYTIPVRDKDGSYCRERYDHDLGGWLTDEVEDVGVQIVSDQAYVSDEPPKSKPWVGLTNDEIALLNADYPHPQGFARALEDKLREKNA